MKRIRMLAVAGAVVFGAAVAAPLDAQERRPDSIPAAYKPPAGMCRIWVDGVPANRQPAPTDCASAVKNRPANGRVIFGDRSQGSSSEPFLQSFGRRKGGSDRGRTERAGSERGRSDTSKTVPKERKPPRIEIPSRRRP
jgi:hypothetical protein